MFILFIKERCAWILFFITLLLCINILFILDTGFSGISIGYFNIVVILLFFLFFLWRYFKETSEIKYFLVNITEISDKYYEDIIELTPIQKKYYEKIFDVVGERDNELNHMKVKIQENTEEILAWVHEMKTPLTAMKLMIEQLENVKIRTKLEKEWIRINHLLDQQLHSTRLATIEKDNRFEKVVLHSIVTKEIREYQSWCIEKGIGFQIENLNFEVTSDQKWLAFIIRQLLSNAIKYSYGNSEIEIYTNIDEQGHLQLHIQDKGIGIEKEDLPRIFEKSYTGTIGRESVQSTGMGLYLANNAANKLGIEMKVQTEVKRGTCFTLRFPIQNEYQETYR